MISHCKSIVYKSNLLIYLKRSNDNLPVFAKEAANESG